MIKKTNTARLKPATASPSQNEMAHDDIEAKFTTEVSKALLMRRLPTKMPNTCGTSRSGCTQRDNLTAFFFVKF